MTYRLSTTKKQTPSRPYFMLFTRINGSWFPQWGDYSKEAVITEDRDTYAKDYKQADRVILKLPKDDITTAEYAESMLNKYGRNILL